MNTREYIDSLFSDYQKTSALEDFKEELKSFLDERIRTLVKGGMDEKDAFEKATSELGDISAVADEISRKKKQELIGEMYLKTTHYMSTWRIALYVLCGAVFGFGVIVAAISEYFSGDVNAPLGSLLVFGGIPILVFFVSLAYSGNSYPGSNGVEAGTFVCGHSRCIFVRSVCVPGNLFRKKCRAPLRHCHTNPVCPA